MKAGVPQGLILSPLLFNLYVTDLAAAISTDILQYADDTVILSRHSGFPFARSNDWCYELVLQP